MTTVTQRVAVVTGASSGIGKVTAKALVAQGWHVIATGRDPGRTAAAEAEIGAAAAQGGKLDMLQADLSLMAEAARLAQQIQGLTDRLDVLVNNAGGMTDKLVMTAEGYEQNFAGNHLGPFLLTRELLPLMIRTAAHAPKGSVRILNTASDASEMIPGLNLDDLQNLGNFNPGLAYCSGKLANVMFTRALADRYGAQGIMAHAVHPGVVDSNFFTYAESATQDRMRDVPKQTPEQGADTLLWLVSAEEGASNNGGYWYQRQLRTPPAQVADPAAVQRFWEESEKLLTKVDA